MESPEATPRIYRPTEVVDIFNQNEANKNEPQPGITKLIEQYRTWENKRVTGQDLINMQSYCDFLPGSVTTLLTRSGEERTLGQVAKNFATFKSQLPHEFVDNIQNLGTFLKDEEKQKETPPIILLKDPEVFNGQILDGVHRTLAYVSEFQATDGKFDPGLPAFIGRDPVNKVLLRKLKQTFVREWRLVKPPVLK